MKTMNDVVGVKLEIGDTVFDYSFRKQGVITDFDAEYVLVHFNNFELTSVPKSPRGLISLEPHKITNPEIFLWFFKDVMI